MIDDTYHKSLLIFWLLFTSLVFICKKRRFYSLLGTFLASLLLGRHLEFEGSAQCEHLGLWLGMWQGWVLIPVGWLPFLLWPVRSMCLASSHVWGSFCLVSPSLGSDLSTLPQEPAWEVWQTSCSYWESLLRLVRDDRWSRETQSHPSTSWWERTSLLVSGNQNPRTF